RRGSVGPTGRTEAADQQWVGQVIERGVPVLERGLGVAVGGGGFWENLGCFAAGEFFSRMVGGYRGFGVGAVCGIFRYFSGVGYIRLVRRGPDGTAWNRSILGVR